MRSLCRALWFSVAVFALSGCASSVQLLKVTGLSPATIAAGGGATTVTLTGTQFNGHMTATLGGTPVPTTLVSSTTLTAAVPAAIANTGGSYPLSLVDDEGAQGGVATLATSLTLQVNNPAPAITAVSPAVLVVSGAGMAAVVTGSGFAPATTATVDGTARAVTVQDATHLTLALTADDLLFAAKRTLVLTNPAPMGGTSSPFVLTITNYSKKGQRYAAYGDSITAGYGVDPATQAFPALLAAADGLTLNVAASIGDQACDVFPRHIAVTRDEYTPSNGQVYSLMTGTNDTYLPQSSAFEALFNSCDIAAMSWLALPRVEKTVAGDAALQAAGGCGGTPDGTRMGVLFCAAPGTVTASAVRTFGSPIYLWYLLDNNAAPNATLQVSVDGTAASTVAVAVAPLVSTFNHSSQSIGLLRLPVAAGTHRVSMAAAAGAGVLGLGTVPASRSGLSFLVVGDVPNQLLSQPRATPAVQVQYTADVRANVARLQSDGLDLRFVSTRQFMLGTQAEMQDQLHPNALGHQHLLTAFQTGFVNLNSAAGPFAAVRSGVSGAASAQASRATVVLATGAETALPDAAIVTVRPDQAGTRYRLAMTEAPLVTVGNASANGSAAVIAAADGESVAGAPDGLSLPAGEIATLERQVDHARVSWRRLPAARTADAGMTPALP